MDIPPYVTQEMTPNEAIAHVLRWLDTSPADEMLGRAALPQLEPLVDWLWECGTHVATASAGRT